MTEKSTLGGFTQSTFKTSNGYELATYTWLPACGVAAAKGCVFLMHGVFAHVRFEYLECDKENRRVLYAGSLPEGLNKRDLIVVGHDHVGHGRSSGLRGYVDSFDVLRDTAVEFFEATVAREDLCLRGKPVLVAGMSMGGTVAVEVARVRPNLFTGYVLFSPAVKPPSDMFGLFGRFLKAVSGVLNAVAPRLQVMRLPPSPFAEIRDAVAKDDLVQKDPMRVRLGTEFLRVYSDIDANVESIAFPSLICFVGEHDNIVSPGGMKEFIGKVSSPDKELEVMGGTSHEVLREEPARRQTHAKVYDWIDRHAP